MTKEEAIKLIDDRMCFGRGKWSEHHKPEIDIYWQAGEMAIKALEAEPHWIPVTERPDKSGDYLATLIDGAEKWVEIIYWNETFGGSWQAVIGDEEYYSTIGNVIAWMPLPEPYKEVTE